MSWQDELAEVVNLYMGKELKVYVWDLRFFWARCVSWCKWDTVSPADFTVTPTLDP